MLNRLLFLLTVGVALALGGLVVFGPAMVMGNPHEQPRWLLLFARDATIRRATVACAIGLMITAWVFFRTPTRKGETNSRSKRSRSADTIGA